MQKSCLTTYRDQRSISVPNKSRQILSFTGNEFLAGCIKYCSSLKIERKKEKKKKTGESVITLVNHIEELRLVEPNPSWCELS